MTEFDDEQLYLRGAETLVASWEAISEGDPDATVRRAPGIAIAIFPNEPKRSVFNNAVLDRRLGTTERSDALDAVHVAYAEAGVNHFAVWVHESDIAMLSDLEQRGYIFDSSTRAMGMNIDHIQPVRPEIEYGSLDWAEYELLFGMPAGLFDGVLQTDLRLVTARADGEDVASAMVFDHQSDCGIYNVATLEPARRRGLGSALIAHHLHSAVARSCQTASLQSTPMAEGVYAAAGFRDLGRFLEFVPSV